ncbi:MAG TPA: hypothetical protein VK709_17165 [Candidatus Saccharimonadales bacterium]|jgi:hypothetical protein|nr:hypothetical protein [Candidatus Saccharimonadales bacterium]
MLLPLAILLLHPQIAPKISTPTEMAALHMPADVSASSNVLTMEGSAPADEMMPAETAMPAAETSSALPAAPMPVEPVQMNAPVAFINPAKTMKVSVEQLIAENRRKQMAWKGLAIASSGAATFDAWTTRHAITKEGAVELNPMLRPFAGNSSLYAAIQVGPALMDFAGKKMMYSRYSWVRHMWWVPQSASFVGSIFCGAHNLSFH